MCYIELTLPLFKMYAIDIHAYIHISFRRPDLLFTEEGSGLSHIVQLSIKMH